MNIILSKFSGYCYGVKRAISIAQNSIGELGKVYSLGSIIHNKRAVEKLENQGLQIVDDIDKNYKNILFRSHGVEKKFYNFANEHGMNIIDTTCTFVKKIHQIVADKYKSGNEIIIIGNKSHPEVIGINSWCDYTAQFVGDEKYVEKLKIDKNCNYVLVFQTTFNIEKYEEIVSKISEKTENLEIFNTICNATKKRQDAILEISEKVDMIVVIGDKSSSNSKKLYELASSRCKSIFVEDCSELDRSMFENVKNVGITAGASTPDFVIDEVIKYIQDLN